MGQKRSSTGDYPSPKRLQRQAALEETDPIYEEAHSDLDYSSHDNASIVSGSLHDTPATPFSTTSTSVKYPSELKTHLCPFEGCTKAFNRPARLQEHLRSHNNERLFSCTHDGCDKTFLRASHLNHHVKSAHTGVRDYVCDRPGCGKSFVTGSRLRRHLAAHDGQDKYRCTEYPPCNETFRKHSTLQKHVLSVHLKQKPFQCTHINSETGEKCTMAFESAGHLRAHESRVHTEKRFSCAECTQRAEEAKTQNQPLMPPPASFPTYSLLQAHIRAAHPPQCPNCAVTCSTARELRRHLEVAHGNVSLDDRRIFPCTLPGCDRSFTKKGNLTVHIRTVHDGEKRFVCGETDLSASKRVAGWSPAEGCGKRYGSKLALEEHIRTAHLGFQNSKAERRQKLGKRGDSLSTTTSTTNNTDNNSNNLSALATLTGEGYADATGRQITCLISTCPHRFHRNYDLWVHMGSKHNYTEDDIRDMFLQRALLGDGNGNGSDSLPGDVLGIYGLEFDNESPSIDRPDPFAAGPETDNGHCHDHDYRLPEIDMYMGTDLYAFVGEEFPPREDFFGSKMLPVSAGEPTSTSTSKIPIPTDDMMIDPFLDFNTTVNS
ncbi:C2H2-type zinc finger protein [Aspergillus undulatus]|uniref:C2H2-type zinc finger protein n=1 Tax=Aspergillus undulatus TaxID=1810928 RepID=UPI003CCDFEC0